MITIKSLKFNSKTVIDKYSSLNNSYKDELTKYVIEFMKSHGNEVDKISKCYVSLYKQIVISSDMLAKGILKK